MRPQSIVNFERLAVIALVVGVAATLWRWQSLVARIAHMGVDPTYLPVMEAMGVVIVLALIFGAARKASTAAKWVYVILFILGAVSIGRGLPNAASHGLSTLVSIVQFALQATAIYFLFTPAANAWFAGRASGVPPID